MPPIVAHGHVPDAYACGYCHSPTGQGRPENASLAGLPAAYILNQVADFKTGAHFGADALPMRAVVKNLDITGMIDAAAYAASLPP